MSEALSSPLGQILLFICLVLVLSMIHTSIKMVRSAVQNRRAKRMRSEWVVLWKEGER